MDPANPNAPTKDLQKFTFVIQFAFQEIPVAERAPLETATPESGEQAPAAEGAAPAEAVSETPPPGAP
jgi:hypothetical protein